MSLARLRVAISVIVLLTYLLALIILAVGASLRWVGIPDATEMGRAIVPLFSGYVAAVIGFYFTADRPAAARDAKVLASNERRPKQPSVPKPIARMVVLAVIVVCASVPLSLLLRCWNIGPLAEQPLIMNVIAAEQSVIAGLVGVLIATMLTRNES